MAQDRYVTSAAIEGIRTEIRDDVIPSVRAVGALVDETTLDFPGWGAVGELAIGSRYREVQDDVRQKFEDAVTVLENWMDALWTARINWRTAEDMSSVVVYR
ncbi:hypothetical protein HNP84_007943 [Thermocatellispora tengchongensis]|uniref:WXG100 family type VII secretion target n=1 Tax=Thermocatellispora tengchongensis TaxID=1073253 RepID=A0A840PKQ4_9ACTN|nr:hypothetical protein [Thermocatellispora tengchongensis]MBB5138190.1 hypothetical protein [Thermocatellispora tengchongensis]